MIDHDPTDLAGQEIAAEDRLKEFALARKQLETDVKRIFGNESGRRILWRILADSGVFKSSFRLNNEMAYLEGRRSIGLELLVLVNEICPDNYIRMLEEHKSK